MQVAPARYRDTSRSHWTYLNTRHKRHIFWPRKQLYLIRNRGIGLDFQNIFGFGLEGDLHGLGLRLGLEDHWLWLWFRRSLALVLKILALNPLLNLKTGTFERNKLQMKLSSSSLFIKSTRKDQSNGLDRQTDGRTDLELGGVFQVGVFRQFVNVFAEFVKRHRPGRSHGKQTLLRCTLRTLLCLARIIRGLPPAPQDDADDYNDDDDENDENYCNDDFNDQCYWQRSNCTRALTNVYCDS